MTGFNISKTYNSFSHCFQGNIARLFTWVKVKDHHRDLIPFIVVVDLLANLDLDCLANISSNLFENFNFLGLRNDSIPYSISHEKILTK
jgi:hypothetical protein